MIRREVLVGGSAAMAGTAAARVSLDATQLGARGDGAADDAPAIQAALDRLGQSGGAPCSCRSRRSITASAGG